VISRLQEIDSIPAHSVHQAMFLREPPRPATSKFIFQGFRFADSSKRIAQNALYDFKRA
jgi:hypothetical protein